MREKIKNIILVLVIIGLIGLIWYLANSKEPSSDKKMDDNTSSFISELDDFIANLDSNMNLSEAKNSIAGQMVDLSKFYSEGDLVGYTSQDILNTMRDKNIKSTDELKNELSKKLDEISNDYDDLVNPSTIQPRQISIKSNTACSIYGSNSVYCLENNNDKLNGYVYINSSTSKKWVLLLHGNAAGGVPIFNQIGSPYIAKGYNILAPDLRGQGKSGGINSWGYLESLDAYDWVKWLNENYSVDTLVVHGVSLGAFVGLQLVTNQDFSSSLRNQYHFKGLVEDSGYVSLTELVKGLINAGDTMDLDLFIDNTEDEMGNFEKNVTSVINELGLEIDQKVINDLVNGNISTDEFEKIINGYYQNRKATADDSKLLADNSAVTDDVIKQYIISNGAFGINESNFDTCENVFANGRNFKSSDKVLIIHSKTDDIINYHNAVIVDNNAREVGTKFKFYWNVENQPHAFILAGLQKDNYYNLIKPFLRCIDDDSFCADGNFSNYETLKIPR